MNNRTDEHLNAVLTAIDEIVPEPPPLPSSRSRRPVHRRPLPVAVSAFVAVLILIGLVALAVRPGADESYDVANAPSAPLTGSSDEVGVEYWLPEDGWLVIEEPLTDLSGLPSVFVERTKGTIISFATFDANPGSPIVECAFRPQAALEQLGPHDALISVLESTEIMVSEYPDRRRATGIYEGSPEDLYPYIGDVTTNDSCYDRANEGRAAPLFYREYAYNDQGRAFIISVAIGGEATEEVRRQAWSILDKLEYRPATQV